MSNSLEFCKRIAQDPARSTYSDREWSNAIEKLDTKLLFDEILNGDYKYRCTSYVDHDRLEFDIEIELNADADFDYFTSDTIIHDGSLCFAPQLVCVQNVVRGWTYNKNIGEPERGDRIKYTVGNFVFLNEYDGDWVPADKPWMRERVTVLLPLKYEKL